MIERFRTKWKILKDNLEVWSGKRHPLVPPSRYGGINLGDNNLIGEEFFRYFTTRGKVKPESKILEVGSGFGRMAIPFTTYLNANGSYDGLEILTDGYNWCKSNFTAKFPNFNFHKIEVYNKRYNPEGTIKATEYKFPFPDNSFDFIWLTSVFTHMFWEEIENYLSEIYRVLKPGAISCITWYIMDEKSLELTAKSVGTYNFRFKQEDYWIESQKDPLFQIAFEHDKVQTLYIKTGFNQVDYQKGKWSGFTQGLSFQDLIWAQK